MTDKINPDDTPLCQCGHPESQHETVEYRGSKDRACNLHKTKECWCMRFTPVAPDDTPARLLERADEWLSAKADPASWHGLPSSPMNLVRELRAEVSRLQQLKADYEAVFNLKNARIRELEKKLEQIAKERTEVDYQ
jgi:hypothetical protein